MTFTVNMTAAVELDILEIHAYIVANDSYAAAMRVIDKIEEACLALETFPQKGHVPPELDRIGVEAYREVHCMPFRIIYEVRGREVFVHAVLDGRRDLQSLLEWRLLRYSFSDN